MIFWQMSVAITSLLRDKAATILASLALCIFTVSLFINRNQVLLYFFVSGNFHKYVNVTSLISFRSKNKSGSVVSEQAALDHFLMHVPDEV